MRTRIWTSFFRDASFSRRAARRRLEGLYAEMGTTAYALVVGVSDVDHRRFFPNAFLVDNHDGPIANLRTDDEFQDLDLIGDGSFALIVCPGVLQRVSEPGRLVSEFHRILTPGGRLVLSLHRNARRDGAGDGDREVSSDVLRRWFSAWSGFEMLRGTNDVHAVVVR